LLARERGRDVGDVDAQVQTGLAGVGEGLAHARRDLGGVVAGDDLVGAEEARAARALAVLRPLGVDRVPRRVAQPDVADQDVRARAAAAR